ncbi:glycosyltransferase [candidate division WOR-3 bacterium]|nr:glycosyltransferase [candidate division WOR-3 bacterium]
MPNDASVIIITLDRPALLRDALASLAVQTRRPDEVVVIDNGPDEETERVVESFRSQLPVRYLAEPRRGYGAARNRGLREARGRILVFLDDDCVAEPDWMQTLLQPLEAGAAEMVGGSRDCRRAGLAARLDYLSADAPVLHPRLPRRYVPHLSTSNLALWRAVSDEIGWFDESLATCEDRDFCRRAVARGYRVLYEPAARVHHRPPIAALGDYWRRMVRYGRGTSEYFLLHRDSERIARLFPASPVARLLMLPLLAAAGRGGISSLATGDAGTKRAVRSEARCSRKYSEVPRP